MVFAGFGNSPSKMPSSLSFPRHDSKKPSRPKDVTAIGAFKHGQTVFGVPPSPTRKGRVTGSRAVPYPATLVSGKCRSASKPRYNQKIPFLLTLSTKKKSRESKKKKVEEAKPVSPPPHSSHCPAGSSQGSISPTFYEQLLHTQIPKEQKSCLFALLESACVKAAQRMLVKLTPAVKAYT